MTQDLAHLLAQTALRDRASFDALYSRTCAKLFGVCLRILKDRSSAEDALQDVYIKIWHKSHQYRPDLGHAMGWMTTMTRNHCIDLLRKTPAPQQDIDTVWDLADKAPNPEEAALNSETRSQIDVCLGELDPQKADAVRGAYLEGYTYAELATAQDIPLNTIRTWLRRGLQQLRECMSR